MQEPHTLPLDIARKKSSFMYQEMTAFTLRLQAHPARRVSVAEGVTLVATPKNCLKEMEATEDGVGISVW